MTSTAQSTTAHGDAEPYRGHRHLPHHWRDVHPSRRGPVLAWLAFTITFLISRVVTGVIKIAGENSGNIDGGGMHLHHFVWGICLVSGVACYGLFDRSDGTHTWMGICLGIGLGLIIDEIALLVTFKDLYWTSAGWSSVAVAVAVIGIGGTVLVGSRSHRCTVDPDDPACRRPKVHTGPASATADPAQA